MVFWFYSSTSVYFSFSIFFPLSVCMWVGLGPTFGCMHHHGGKVIGFLLPFIGLEKKPNPQGPTTTTTLVSCIPFLGVLLLHFFFL